MPPWPPRVALITGAASGLGRRLAQLVADDGVSVAGLDLNAAGLQAVERELRSKNAKASFEVADVTNSATLQQAVDRLEQMLGPIEMLIASAGIGVETSALAFDPSVFAKIIEVNLIGVANSVAAVLPGMLSRRRGHLVAISSLASYRGLPFMAGYCASKSGLNALMEALRVEVEPRGIATTLVCPGWTKTPMTDKLQIKVPLMLDVEYSANRIFRAIRRRQRFVAFPWASRGPLALLRWLPCGVADWFVGRMMRAAKRK